MTDFNPYAAPAADTSLRPGPEAGGLWRSGRLLVMDKAAALPDACVTCNAPAGGFALRRRLAWHSPWWYLLLLGNLLIYIVAALIVQKKAVIRVGLCPLHRGRRRTCVAVAWSLAALGVALPIGLGMLAPDAVVYGIIALPFLLLTGALVGLYGGRVVYAKRIDDQFAWIGGVSPALLDTLPAWQGAST